MTGSFSQRHGRPSARRAAAFVAALAGVLAACTGSVGVAGPVPTPSTVPASASPAASAIATTPAASESPSAAPSASPATTAVRVYLFQPDAAGGDAHLVPVTRTVPFTRAVATAAVRELLSGPAPDETALLTMIPAGSQLLGITIDGSVATVDLTGTFESGGGSASMLGRVAQLVYTATQFPTVDAVRVRLDGRPVDSIGGEGVIVGAGVGRMAATGSLPPIFVDGPTWGGDLPNPGRVTGLANVFEAQFTVQVLDSQGRVLAEAPVQATCGTGCWGTFDVTIPYRVASAQPGTLRVFDTSPKDGTPIDVRGYPVELTPAG
jgi:spore germination protein GerM